MKSKPAISVAQYAPAVLGVAAGYYVLARVGLELALAGTASCPIWPASGLAVVAGLALGPRACFGVFLGSWVANLHALPGVGGAPAAAAVLACGAVAAGSGLQALLGARVFEHELGGRSPLSRGADVVRFAALTPAVCLVSATIGVGSLAAAGLMSTEVFGHAWLTWWIGDAVGVLITAPLLVAWRPRETDEFGELPSPRRALIGAAALGGLWLSVWLGFGEMFPAAARYPMSFLPFTALIWITLRLDFRGATLGAAALAALVQWHTVRGVGPFAVGRTLNESLLLASAYIAAAAVTAFLLRALLAELTEARAGLERRVSEQGDDLWAAQANLRAAAVGRREDGRRIQLYRRIVAELPVGICVLRLEDPHDPDSWVIVEFNPAGLRLSAAGEENPAGRRLLDYSPALQGGEFMRACAEALRLNRTVEIPDFAGSGRSPGVRFSIKVFPLGAPLIAVSFEDVTARRTAEAAISRSNGELAQFAYVASHDLQAPLRKATAFAEQLRLRLGAGIDDTSRDFLDRLGRSLAGMQTLTEDLLELARIGVGATEPKEIELGPIAAEVLAELDGAIVRSGARVQCSPLPGVTGDPRLLRQLLQNLVENAIKFAAPGKPPSVRIRGGVRADGRRELVVEDDGVGFDMKYAQRVFQPFERLHSKADFPGHGMGLSICKKIVERHGGEISVDSAVGRGTRFTVILPAGRARAGARSPLENAAV